MCTSLNAPFCCSPFA